jgi:hypothetical protein
VPAWRTGRVRGVAASATVLQPACNSQHVVFAVVSMAVARLHALPSRHARACVRERTHARTCTREVATLQPHSITYKYHMLTGCISVAPWLHAQPAYFCRRIGADRACVGNILAGGNDGAVRQVLPSTVMQGRPRETFGVFAGRSSAGRSIGGAAGRSDLARGFRPGWAGMADFYRFRGARRRMLEW